MPPAPPPPPKPPAADPVLAALADLRIDDASWPPPEWVRGLVGSADLHLVMAAARADVDVAVPWLAALLTLEALERLLDVTDGDAPVRAAWVLAGLDLTSPRHLEIAVDALLVALLSSELDDPLFFETSRALIAIGAPALETVLATHAAERDDPEALVTLEGILAASRLDDPRIRALLLARLEADEETGADLCADHGDPRYLAPIRARWDALPTSVDPDDVDQARRGQALGEAVVALEGPWSDADRAKLAAYEAIVATDDAEDGLADDLRDILDEAGGFAPTVDARAGPPTTTALDEAMDLERVDDTPAEPLVRREVPGRNDPCWCGSGKKYKKCHADADAKKAGAKGDAPRA